MKGESAFVVAVGFLVGNTNVIEACAREGREKKKRGGRLVPLGAGRRFL